MFFSNFTLDLRLVHNKELVVPTALKLLARTAMETHFFILQVMEGEQRSREATVTPVSSQNCQWFLLTQKAIIRTRPDAHIRFPWRNTSIISSPSLCTCPHTCPQTCFGWRRWRGEPPWRFLAGGSTLWKWHCRLKKQESTQTKEFSLQFLSQQALMMGIFSDVARPWPVSSTKAMTAFTFLLGFEDIKTRSLPDPINGKVMSYTSKVKVFPTRGLVYMEFILTTSFFFFFLALSIY